MKNVSVFILLSLLIASCDAPRDRRSAYNKTFNDNQSNTSTSGSAFGNNDSNSDDSTGTSTGGDTTTDTPNTVPDEIKHCKWSADGESNFDESHPHLGEHTICLSTNKKDVWIQVKSPSSDGQVCVIPTHNSGTSSVYIGEPRCLMITNSKKIYKVTLYANRSGYQNFSITGAMVMKDKSYFYPAPFYQYVLTPDAYIYCSQFLDQYKDPTYCEAFKKVGQYIYKAF
ncbi:hypothetical protein A9Q84_06255 [Halobacteriovorax marinus]|uniref:Lipoprotein n=1 Tax=Halobacteriovorax marinus TaxID=97084 RepID=A0A1Y5F9E0_9BACT|nr:hypothetical protein A9Q84_06255 [Halobacteriovorax marinus]